MESFFSSGHSPAINKANEKELPEQVKKNEDHYKDKK
jgi:hypothetical protein